MAGQCVDLLFRSEQGETDGVQAIGVCGCHALYEFVIGAAALCKSGEIQNSQSATSGGIERGESIGAGFENGDGRFDDACMQPPVFIAHIRADESGTSLAKADAKNGGRVGRKPDGQVFIDDDDTFFSFR